MNLSAAFSSVFKPGQFANKMASSDLFGFHALCNFLIPVMPYHGWAAVCFAKIIHFFEGWFVLIFDWGRQISENFDWAGVCV